jgi:hypothetical protein
MMAQNIWYLEDKDEVARRSTPAPPISTIPPLPSETPNQREDRLRLQKLYDDHRCKRERHPALCTTQASPTSTNKLTTPPAPEQTYAKREDSSNSNISSKLEVSSISHSLNKLSIPIFLVGDDYDYLGSRKTST